MSPLGILEVIAEHSPIRAVDISERTGVAMGDVYAAILALEAEGSIEMGHRRAWSCRARPVPKPAVCLANLRIKVPRPLPAVPPAPLIGGNREVRRLLPATAGTFNPFQGFKG